MDLAEAAVEQMSADHGMTAEGEPLFLMFQGPET